MQAKDPKATGLDKYAVRSWQVDHVKTVDKFKLHLEYAVYLFRRDGYVDINQLEDDMNEIEWSKLVNGWIKEVGDYAALTGKDGKENLEKVVTKFKSYLDKHSKAEAEREKNEKLRNEQRRSHIFQAFADLEKDVAPKPTIIQAVLISFAVKPKDIAPETLNIENEIKAMMEGESPILAVQQGQGGGLMLLKDASGKPTEKGKTYKPRPPKAESSES